MKKIVNILFFILLLFYLFFGYLKASNLYFYSKNHIPVDYNEISISDFYSLKGTPSQIYADAVKSSMKSENIEGNVVCVDEEFTCYVKLDNNSDYNKLFNIYKENLLSIDKPEFEEFQYENYHRYMAKTSQGYYYFIGINNSVIFNIIYTVNLDDEVLKSFYNTADHSFMFYYRNYIGYSILFVLLYILLLLIIKFRDKIIRFFKHRLFLPILLIVLGALPFAFTIVFSILSFIFGFSFLGSKSYGFQGFIDSIMVLGFVYLNLYIIGAILLGLGIFILWKRKKKK